MNSQADMGNTLETCWVGTDIGRIGRILGFMGQPYPFILKIRPKRGPRGAEAATLKQVKAG
jgi:hypothetical protein